MSSITPRIIVLLLLVFAPSRADNNGGSGYSHYGIGDIRYFITGQAAGMGGAGLAVLTTDDIDRINPAAWTQINRTRFSLSVLYEGFSTTDATGSVYLSGTMFDGFAVAFPIAPRSGIVACAGIAPYSRINYNVRTPGSEGGLDYWVQYIGSGGLSSGFVGTSVTIPGEIHLGARFDYYFGTLDYTTRQSFDVTDYTSAVEERSIEMRGVGLTFGLIYSGLKNLLALSQKSNLTIGAVFSTASNLTTSEDDFFTYNTVTLNTLDTVTIPGGTSHLPFAVGGGISFSSDRLLLAADAYYQNWSRFTLNDSAETDLRNSLRVSGGAELSPKREASARFLQRLTYRAGAFYDQTYYYLRGEPINEVGVTCGVGVPIIGDTRLSVSAQYSIRGTTDEQLQKARILRISLTLNGGELWFVRPPEE